MKALRVLIMAIAITVGRAVVRSILMAPCIAKAAPASVKSTAMAPCGTKVAPISARSTVKVSFGTKAVHESVSSTAMVQYATPRVLALVRWKATAPCAMAQAPASVGYRVCQKNG